MQEGHQQSARAVRVQRRLERLKKRRVLYGMVCGMVDDRITVVIVVQIAVTVEAV